MSQITHQGAKLHACYGYRMRGIRAAQEDSKMTSYAFTNDLTDGAMTAADACAWARGAEDGDSLIDWDESGLSDAEDRGNRAGLSDPTLDDVERILSSRGLSLEATDEGLVAVARGES